MVRKSRFLRQGSAPPSSSAYSHSFRATSTTPSSRSFYRELSIAPSRSYRESSAAPMRASSVAPLRASSVAPYYRSTCRASSVTPYTSPYSYNTTRSLGAGSRPLRTSSLSPQSMSSFRSTSMAPRMSGSSYRIDTSVPTRQFGTRLGVHKMETSVKPAIYDEYYGMTYIPSSGRDSWSAYRISDETLDDNDDMVYESAKKDYEVMKRVNKQIVEAMTMQPPVHRPVEPAYRRFTPKHLPQIVLAPRDPEVEAMTMQPPVHRPVEPAYRRFTPKHLPQIIHVPRDPELNNAVVYRRPPRIDPGVYREPAPAVRVSYSTVYDGSELLRPKHKTFANESVDIDRPATYAKLKERLNGARMSMDRSRVSTSKYNTDPELRAIDSEVGAIKKARAMREQSLVPDYSQMVRERKTTSDLRKRIRSTLRRTK